MKCELLENVVCVWSVYEGVDDRRGAGVCEFVAKWRSVSVSVVAEVRSSNVTAVLSVEEEPEKLEVLSPASVMPDEEEMVLVVVSAFTKFLCVATSLLVCVNGEDVSGDGECVRLSVLCGAFV